MDEVLTQLSTIGRNDQALYLFCIVSSLYLTIPLKFIKPAVSRHIYGTLCGLAFCLMNFGLYSTGFCVVTSLITWFLINLKTSRQIVFVFAFTSCSLAHLWIMYHDYLGWHMDFTGVQNILTLKFVMWSFDLNYYFESTASTLPRKPVSEDDFKNNNNDFYSQTAQFDEKVKFERRPTFIEYMSHLFWFTNVLTMPIFSPQQHIHWVRKANTKDSFFPATRALIYASVVGLGGFFIGGWFPVLTLTSLEWREYSFVIKCLYLWVSILVAKTPYYVAWLLAESATISCGMGREASWISPPGIKNPDRLWSGASTVHVLGVELSRNFVEITQAWNFSTSGWLRHYIYLRLPKPYATFATFLVSALWHGFYPGYYLAFIGAAFHTVFGRHLFKVCYQFKELSWISTIALIAINSFLTNYLFAGFILLDWKRCWIVYSETWFVGHAIILVALVVFYVKRRLVKNKN